MEAQHIRVFEFGKTVDDLVGPLINRAVIVEIVRQASGRALFRDIEGAAIEEHRRGGMFCSRPSTINGIDSRPEQPASAGA
jgi:hypothetical protein